MHGDLVVQAMRLRGSLQHFESTCREYPVQTMHTVDALSGLTSSMDGHDPWVRRIGLGFRAADIVSRFPGLGWIGVPIPWRGAITLPIRWWPGIVWPPRIIILPPKIPILPWLPWLPWRPPWPPRRLLPMPIPWLPILPWPKPPWRWPLPLPPKIPFPFPRLPILPWLPIDRLYPQPFPPMWPKLPIIIKPPIWRTLQPWFPVTGGGKVITLPIKITEYLHSPAVHYRPGLAAEDTRRYCRRPGALQRTRSDNLAAPRSQEADIRGPA